MGRLKHAEAGILDGVVHWSAERPGTGGVGAAFDFLAGTKSQAPVWMQQSGLEWTYRLAYEPRRPWKRYVPLFSCLR